MRTVGVVCEYNPFHLGHARQLALLRQQDPEAAVVCLMSGLYVQRGQPAVFSRQVRARAALLAGADLVLELPLPWAVSSAEGFAAGGVQALAATGVVEHLLFGSECGDVSALERVAAALLAPSFRDRLREVLPGAVSFAAARHRVLQGPAGAERPPPAGDHPEGGQRPRRRPGAGHPPLGLRPPGAAAAGETGGGPVPAASGHGPRL